MDGSSRTTRTREPVNISAPCWNGCPVLARSTSTMWSPRSRLNCRPCRRAAKFTRPAAARRTSPKSALSRASSRRPVAPSTPTWPTSRTGPRRSRRPSPSSSPFTTSSPCSCRNIAATGGCASTPRLSPPPPRASRWRWPTPRSRDRTSSGASACPKRRSAPSTSPPTHAIRPRANFCLTRP